MLNQRLFVYKLRNNRRVTVKGDKISKWNDCRHVMSQTLSHVSLGTSQHNDQSEAQTLVEELTNWPSFPGGLTARRLVWGVPEHMCAKWCPNWELSQAKSSRTTAKGSKVLDAVFSRTASSNCLTTEFTPVCKWLLEHQKALCQGVNAISTNQNRSLSIWLAVWPLESVSLWAYLMNRLSRSPKILLSSLIIGTLNKEWLVKRRVLPQNQS